MCTYKTYSQESEDPRWSHNQSTLSNQQCPPVTTTKTDQRTETEKDRNHHGNAEKTSKQTNWRDNRSKQSPHPSIRNKRTVLSETMRRYKDLQIRANWIPGGHLRFHVLNSSAKCRSSTSENKSSLAKCLSRIACVMQKSRKSKFTGAVRQTSGSSPLLRIAIASQMILPTKNCWCPNRKLDPLPAPNWWASRVSWIFLPITWILQTRNVFQNQPTTFHQHLDVPGAKFDVPNAAKQPFHGANRNRGSGVVTQQQLICPGRAFRGPQNGQRGANHYGLQEHRQQHQLLWVFCHCTQLCFRTTQRGTFLFSWKHLDATSLNIKTPPDTEATFHDASQKPTTVRGPTLGDPSREGVVCTRWRRVNNQRNIARKHASAAPVGFDWNRARYDTEKHKSALDKATHANCPRTLRYHASPSAVRGPSSPCFSRSL